MALNNLVATIYRFLHETCSTFGTNTKVQFGCLLSTVLSSTKNQHYFVRNKSTEEMRRFTLLVLIFVQKTYYFDLPSCVRTNLPSCLAREMAMICGQETDYFNPFTFEWVLRALIDFTLSNARRFYSSMGNLLDGKGLTTSKAMSLLTTSKTMSLLNWVV